MPETPTTPATPAKKPDAIMVPAGLILGGTASDKANQIRERFGPVLGNQRVYCRNQGQFNFLTVDLGATYLHPKDHPTAPGQHRYRWEPSPDDKRILYGFLAAEGDGEKS